ncbi:fibrillin-2-like [Saccostrea cucullata]|uniref:fibrillin-2-like n=1 Tax=Saccostrea cuccullata TaxID=36930 RepID=UPI002ED48BE7
MASFIFLLVLLQINYVSSELEENGQVPYACATPGPINHGTVLTWGGNLLVEYICDDGFFPIGDVFGACIEEEGKWTINSPICVAKGCAIPPAPVYGYVSMDDEGQIAKFTCGRSHYLLGAAEVFCEGGGLWSSPSPKCIGPGSRNPSTEKLRVKNETKEVSVEQPPSINFTAEIREADGTCIHQRYRTPPPIPHATAVTPYHYNKYKRVWVIYANYTCDEGYHFQSNHSRYMFCQSYKWTSPDQPVCLKDVIHPCVRDNGNCTQLCIPGEGLDYFCDCYRGYGLVKDGKTCADRDECVIDNGGCEQECRNTVGSRYCLCRQGYVAVGNVCFDIDECQEYRKNLCPGECINTPGSFTCNCSIPGYLHSPTDKFCEDVNECKENNGDCQEICVNTVGSYHCECGEGLKLEVDDHNCTDVNECEEYGPQICKNGDCINWSGVYQCLCHHGYQQHKDGIHCTDLNECLDGNNGGCQDLCVNTVGSYHCACSWEGYQLDRNKTECIDVDECAADNGGCENLCINTYGAFYCFCEDEGFVVHENGKNCTACRNHQFIDDRKKLCIDCPENSIATQTHIAYSLKDCYCDSGYQGDPGSGLDCLDINECIDNTLNCSGGCLNLPGNAICTCPMGFFLEKDNMTCSDVDECLSHDGGCEGTCVNTQGSYHCLCPVGYELNFDNHTCLDINECWLNNFNCLHECINLAGSAECACYQGYDLQDDGKSCVDVDECAESGVCEDTCTNTDGSFRCMCTDSGYKLSWDDSSCSDINECMEGENDCEDHCINVLGSYRCECTQPGYTVSSDGHTCEDVDECQMPNLNKCKHRCLNLNGGFTCRCHPGYTNIGYYDCIPCAVGYYSNITDFDCVKCPVLSTTKAIASISIDDCVCVEGYHGKLARGEACTDVNECEIDNFGCEHNCYNTEGSAKCGCREGYQLSEDGRNCTDVDECIFNSHYCIDQCINLPGTFKCGCRQGFVIGYDGRYCNDVDECATEHLCEDRCENTWGSYVCLCGRPGTVLAADGISCIPSFEKLQCPEDIFIDVFQHYPFAEIDVPDLVNLDHVTVTPEWIRNKKEYPVGSVTVTIQTHPNALLNDSCTFTINVLEICDVGKYKASNSTKFAAVCLNCEIGTYQNERDKTSCKHCFQGMYQDETGQSDCKYCAPGTFQNRTGQSKCLLCPAGAYQDEYGQHKCKMCHAGTFQWEEGQDICFYCPVGTSQDLTGQAKCKPCKADYYQDEIGASRCKVCPPDIRLYPDNVAIQQQCPELN